ncbi:MAG: NAD+ kinase [Candidatus Wallbacteria bacterium]|nr:NAD+ kinase [Candidatus Wallbacteria bacterium]
MAFEKLVLVTRKTRLQGLIERFNSKGQARFYIEHAGGDFADYESEDAAYRQALDTVRRSLEFGLKVQVLERSLVPTCLFTEHDVIVTLGQDGLVANTAKYVGEQPIVAVNPDPVRFDGVLLPFLPDAARRTVARVLEGGARFRAITMAEAVLDDGQRLLGFNDLFIGSASHVSARYRISHAGATVPHSSSGVLVCTGAGSTGWLSSVFNMAGAVGELTGGQTGRPLKLEWEDSRLVFVVREPFASKHSAVDLAAGVLSEGEDLILESLMPSGGVVFSDGVEADYLAFNSGAVARVHAARQRARLAVP